MIYQYTTISLITRETYFSLHGDKDSYTCVCMRNSQGMYVIIAHTIKSEQKLRTWSSWRYLDRQRTYSLSLSY